MIKYFRIVLLFLIGSYSNVNKADGLSCSEIVACKRCDNPRNLESWSHKKALRYGGTFKILSDLKNKVYDNFDEYFFKHYGAYFFALHTSKNRKIPNKLQTMKYLIDNGVHPYMKVSNDVNVIENVIGSEDKEAFVLIFESGLLESCSSQLSALVKYSKNLNDPYFYDLLKYKLDSKKPLLDS